jgi:hypothetical protein
MKFKKGENTMKKIYKEKSNTMYSQKHLKNHKLLFLFCFVLIK